jgi:hypothetical protein
MFDAYDTGEDCTIFEREAVAADADMGRISRIEKEVLGTAFVDEGIFLRGGGGGGGCGGARLL